MNYHHRLMHIVGIIAVLLVVYDFSQAQQSEQQPTYRLTTILGTEVVTSIENVTLTDPLLNFMIPNLWGITGPRFLISLEGYVYISIPFSLLKEIQLDSKLHTVTLINGSTFVGKLVGVIQTPERKRYDLANLKSLTPEKKPTEKKPSEIQTRSNPALWELSLPPPYNRSFKVRNVRFVFSYPTREKVGSIIYTIEPTTRVHDTETFFVPVSGQDVVTNLTDFDEIRFNEKAKQRMTLVPAHGAPIETNPVLEISDAYGKHHATTWILRADLVGDLPLSIAVKPVNCRFQKISR
ncbi:MAG: hypothetical protein HY089_09740 [Ignavibacteriales bacterium]|nr:hypothetical protein [Ignavibacteriales bacterium]